MGYFPQKSPTIGGSIAENDLQLKAFYGCCHPILQTPASRLGCKRDLLSVALLQKMTCNSRHPMGIVTLYLRHPRLVAGAKWFLCHGQGIRGIHQHFQGFRYLLNSSDSLGPPTLQHQIKIIKRVFRLTIHIQKWLHLTPRARRKQRN